MSLLISFLAFAGLVGCYEVATRMTPATRHGIRIALITIGGGCLMSMAHAYDVGVAVLLVGMGMFRMFDKRLYPRDRNHD